MRSFFSRVIQFVILFLLFFILINGIFLLVIIKTDWDFTKRLESLNLTEPNFSLLVFGSSLSQYGVDTELLTKKGIESYNMAMVGSSAKTNFIQLREYLKKYSNRPDYVLFAGNSCLEKFDMDGIQPVVEFTMKNQKIDLKDVPLSKFRWQSTELLKKALSTEYRSCYLSYGHLKRTKILVDLSAYGNEKLEIDKYKSSVWVEEIARLCDQNNIQFVIIEMPGINKIQNTVPIGPYDLKFHDGSKGVLYNFNSREFCKSIDSEKDWSGLSHLNKYGAEKFTLKLIEVLSLQNKK
jgi:hypothetical protein